MSSEVFRLDSLLEITSSKRIHLADYVPSGVPFFRGKEVIERAKGNEISTELFIANEKYQEIIEVAIFNQNV
jgi:type I restriction enzyme S subunit